MELEILEQELELAANEVAASEPALAAAACHDVIFCHWLFQALPSHVARLELLCMNPMQGVPPAHAAAVLEDIDRRARLDGTVFATNAVTTALLSYHLGHGLGDPSRKPAAPALTLFPLNLHRRGLGKVVAGKTLLYLLSFVLLNNAICTMFGELLRRAWADGVVQHATRWDFNDDATLASAVSHRAVVYIPEHPYKNVFNDYYALGAPFFVCSPRFLAHLWPQVRYVGSGNLTYDGWFDRGIARYRVPSEHADALRYAPEPFDLGSHGEEKVRFWMRVADYYHFPGVRSFQGVSDLLEQLHGMDDLNTRAVMRQHVVQQHEVTLAYFRFALERLPDAGHH